MTGKIRFQSFQIYLFLIFSSIGFTSCHHKHKPGDNQNIIREMPLPDINKNNYSPESYHKEILRNDERIFTVVEQMPQFPGGEAVLMSSIAQNLKYPVIAQENGIQGKVIVRFLVEKDGSISKVEVVRSLDPACDKEAIRLIRSLPKFIPAKQNGVNVAVWYTLPITFKLK